MRAWQINGAFGLDQIKLNEVPQPEPGPGQVLLRVKAVSLNYRDLLVAGGMYSRKVPAPLTLCSDAAGEVAAVGAGVRRFEPGQRVVGAFMPGWLAGPVDDAKARTALGAFAQGVLAEYAVFPEQALVPTPVHLSDTEAATLPCAGVTAWNALVEAGRIRAGDLVLVQGTGGVSIFALQFALQAGAQVFATSSSNEKLSRLRDMGAQFTVNYSTTPDWEETVRKTTGGVDHVVEIGGSATFDKSVRATRMGGSIYLIGNRAEGTAEVNLTTVLMKAIRVQGVFVGSVEMLRSMCRAIDATNLKPVVGREFDFANAAHAFAEFSEGKHFGKVVIRVC